ncbi:MAG: response regulator [Lachnospiraceae bacterium]
MQTLLVVEDEKLIRQGICAMVKRSGVYVERILECSNGEMALEILQKEKVNVVLTDIRMPKMDGITLVKEIQKLEEKPYVVAISGFDDFSYVVELLRSGVKDYLLKPIDRNKLKEVLTSLELEISRKEKETQDDNSLLLKQLRELLVNGSSYSNKGIVISRKNSVNTIEDFVVCCMDGTYQEEYLNETVCYLPEVEEHDVYLVKKDSIDLMLKQEWRKKYVGISSVQKDITTLREAYLEAVDARTMAFMQEEKIVYYEPKTIELDKKPLDEKQVLSYVQMLGTDKSSQVIRFVRMLIWETKQNKDMAYFFQTIQIFFEEINHTYDSLLQRDAMIQDKLRKPRAYISINEYENELICWIEHFVEKLHADYEDHRNKQKIQKAIIYIAEHYNQDINMAVVSNEISMNYSLFSINFKKYTGNNFVNYLKVLRVSKAKEYLEHTEMRIQEISQCIGYENEKHFMKIFKATVGVSPTEYRKNIALK